jgi:uncharacterized damage-inducible protein DinB
MSLIDAAIKSYKFNRGRTLALLDQITSEQADPQAPLAWRPGTGRAHIGWQLTHIAITEDIFSSERLSPGKAPRYADLWPRFRGGSTPDDNVPTVAQIRDMLDGARESLLETISGLTEDRLTEIPESLRERGWRILDVLYIISWHEAHHQGQAHLTYNLFKASHPAA